MGMVHPVRFSLELGTSQGAVPFAIPRSFFTSIGANQKKFPFIGWLLAVGQFQIADILKTHLADSFRFTG
jgi:hypothetical protein